MLQNSSLEQATTGRRHTDALLEIEFALGQSVDEAGFCSYDKREHFIGSAHHHSILHVFSDRKMVVDVEAPEPMNVEEGHMFITNLLIQAFAYLYNGTGSARPR